MKVSVEEDPDMPVKVFAKKKYDGFLLDTGFESNARRIGILGASGCGKSLTLKSIAGLVKPDSGIISVNGNVLFDSQNGTDIKAQKRNVGYMFQEYALFPNMSVEGNINAALHAAGHAKNAYRTDINVILQEFELTDVRNHLPAELSGGQKQRCALARMMASDPQLLLLDEPFAAMDTFLREGMRLELIRILDRYDKQAIIVSHDRDELYQMCDWLVLMDNGRVIKTGDTEQVFHDPGTPEAARLTGCKNISRITKTGMHSVRAHEWNDIELVTEDEVGDDITHIGIRAHDLVPGSFGKNVIPCGRSSVSKLPFEWYVTLENGLWWKLPKELGDRYRQDLIPESISIPPDKIVLLKEMG